MMRRPILSAGRQHLHLWCGVWSCSSLDGAAFRIGYGRTWRDAYADWQAQQ